MGNNWPKVRLGEVLVPVSRPVTVEPTTTYSILGAHWYAMGLYTKDVLPGSQIQAKNLYRVERGDFVYNRLFGWKGSFAIARDENHNCYVSNEFPCFLVNYDRADGEYIWKYFTLPSTWEEVLTLSTGGTPTSRNRLKEEQLLGMNIPLPSVSEQRRIVARIEELASKIEEAQGLRQQAVEEVEVLPISFLKHLPIPSGSVTKRISECSKMSTGTTPPSNRTDYYGGAIQWYTPGDLEYQQRLGPSTRTLSEQALAEGKARMFEPSTVLLVAIGGSLGKVGLTHETCSANQQITGIKFSADIVPEYGFWWMRRLGKDLMAAAPQATLPIINQERIGAFEITIPPLSEQRRIVAHLDDLQQKTDSLRAMLAETSAELDALMPSILDKAFRGEL